MKKILLKTAMFLLLTSLSGVVCSQELYVGSGGSVIITPGNFVHIDNDLTIDAAGSLVINSNAGSSGSLLVTGTSTGDIRYNKYKQFARTTLLAPPLISRESMQDFVLRSENRISPASIDHDGDGGTAPLNIYQISYYDGGRDYSPITRRWVFHNHTNPEGTLSENSDFEPGRGYSFRTTEPVSLEFNGTIPNSSLVINLTSTNPANRWKTVSNPFPSFILASTFIADNASQIDDGSLGILVANRTADVGSYEFVLINNASDPYYIAPGEAFAVELISTNENITFSKTSQVHQSQNSILSKNINIPKVEVQLVSGSIRKTTTVKYSFQGTLGLDPGYDGHAFPEENSVLSLATRLISGDRSGEDFMLQFLPNDDYESLVVPLSVVIPVGQKISFSATKQNLPKGINVYIEDRVKNTFERIDNDAYVFKSDASVNGSGRFYIHTSRSRPSSDSGDDVNQENINGIVYKLDNNTLRVRGFDGYDSNINIYDITGKEVMKETFLGSFFNDIKIPNSIKVGVYIVKVSGENKSVTKKIIID